MLVPDEDPAPALEAFDKARGFLRSRVGHALSLRRVPELRFLHDMSAKRGFEISELIDASNRSPDQPTNPSTEG